MAQLYDFLKQKSKYYDKKNFSTQQQYNQALQSSSTVYIGNLSYSTSQDSLKQLFSRVGRVKKIIMGINNKGQRCGFCFVIFQKHQEAERAVQYLSQTKLGEKVIRVDLDPGYQEGRERGRGTDGNQKRDDFRKTYGYGYGERDRDRERGDRKERGDRSDRRERGDKYGYEDDKRGRYDNRKDRDDRDYGRQRYQRNRQYNEQNEGKDQQGGPRKMTRKQQQQKSQQQY